MVGDKTSDSMESVDGDDGTWRLESNPLSTDKFDDGPDFSVPPPPLGSESRDGISRLGVKTSMSKSNGDDGGE